MAPAGTAFRAPARQTLAITKTAPKREFVMISDDELDAPIYAGGDSSDDDEPSRGDIRPSSFQPKESKTSNSAAGSQPRAGKPVSYSEERFNP
jgi:SWI/SNF-related matrix-associated actin-dependent regulator 1 of chromatin subfamily A